MNRQVRPLLEALRSRTTPWILDAAGRPHDIDELLARATWQDEVPDVHGGILLTHALDPLDQIAAYFAQWTQAPEMRAVLPLSAREPVGRVEAFAHRSGAAAVLSAAGGAPTLRPTAGKSRSLRGTATVLPSSGTSGAPKLVAHELSALLASAEGAIWATDLSPDDTWLLSLPLHHVAGLGIVLRTALAGAQMAFPADGEDLLRTLERTRPSHVSLVSTQLRRLLATPQGRHALCGMSAVLVGGGPIPADLRLAAIDVGVPMVVCYGSTETAALLTVTDDPEVAGLPDAAGYLMPRRKLEVDAHGEIWVGGPSLAQGYLTEKGIVPIADARGLFASGDLGRVDRDGCLYVRGRRDRQFICGGENVQPEVIEAALEAIPGVERAAVVPVPDADFDLRPAAFVAGASPVNARAVDEALRRALPGTLVPRTLWQWPSDVSREGKLPWRTLGERAEDADQRAQLAPLSDR